MDIVDIERELTHLISDIAEYSLTKEEITKRVMSIRNMIRYYGKEKLKEVI